ncbi:MAG: adenosine deaminase, partial [Gammaproteobacteria bacterium]
MLYKAELHVHLEGTMSPHLAKRIAEKNSIALPGDISRDDFYYNWHGIDGFLHVYDIASYVLRTEEDYRDLVYEYLASA